MEWKEVDPCVRGTEMRIGDQNDKESVRAVAKKGKKRTAMASIKSSKELSGAFCADEIQVICSRSAAQR